MNSLKPRLDAVCKNADNAFCADCGTRGPRWSSVKLGILICAQCAGIHRKIGTHITFVQSVTIDKWKPEWVDLVEKIGNRISNMFYEANVPSHIKKPAGGESTGGDTMDPIQAAKLEKWIRNKYELKLFVIDGSVDPKDLVLQGKDPRTTEPFGHEPSSPKPPVSPKHKVKKEASVSAPPVVEAIPVEKPSIVLPTTFNWRENVFLASWAKSHSVQ